MLITVRWPEDILLRTRFRARSAFPDKFDFDFSKKTLVSQVLRCWSLSTEYMSNEGSYESAHPRSLTKAFAEEPLANIHFFS